MKNLLLWAMLVCVTAAPVRAATIAVNNTTDAAAANPAVSADSTLGAGIITLRSAIQRANALAGADVITVPAGTYTLTRAGNDATCVNGDLDINGSLTINGAGPAATIVQGATDANFTGSIGDKIFGINQDGTFTNLTVLLSGMTIRYGRNTVANGDPSFAYTGAGIDVFFTGTGNSTTISNCVITGNENVNAYGGGINVDSGNSGLAGDPAIGTVNRGTVKIVDCVLANNKSKNDGAGINLYSDLHSVVITNCVVTNNVTTTSGNGAGINVRHSYGGTVSLLNCNVSSNSAAGVAGGINLSGNQHIVLTGTTISNNVATLNPAFGGGLGITALGFAGFTAIMGVTNCTIVNNHADNGTTAAGGGVYFNGSYSATLENCTIRGNTSDSGAGIANAGSGLGASLTVNNSVITNNTATVSGGGIASLGSISTNFINKCAIIGNSAATSGGGIYNGAGTLTAGFNRIVNNTAPTGRAMAFAGGTANVTNNWWGTNAPAGWISGAPTFTPWIKLTAFASPGSIVAGNATTVTATFLTNSAGTLLTAANVSTLVGLPVTFNNAVKGSLSGAQAAIQSSGTAQVTFNAGSVPGAGSADAIVDGTTATAPITVLCPTITGTVTGTTNICAGQSATIIVALSGGTGVYTVTLNNGGGTKSGNGPLTFNVNPGATTTYSVSSGTDTNGCAIAGGGSATVTVNPNPAAPVISLGSTNVLVNSTTNQASSPAATTYSWTITNGTITTATNLQTITYTAGASGSVGLALRVANASGCTASSQTNVLIQGAPPSIVCPSNMLVNIPLGENDAFIPFSVTANGMPAPGVVCKIGTDVITSPYDFQLGTVTVNCTASNGIAPNATCSFDVTVNRYPAAFDDFFATLTNTALVIAYTSLKANDIDADGQSLTITNGSLASAEGGSLNFGASSVTYTPPPFFFGDDTFSYVIKDTLGASSTGLVHVTVTRPGALRLTIETTPKDHHFTLVGVPGNVYGIQFADQISGPWTNLLEVIAPPNGIADFTADKGPPPSRRFYRARWTRAIPSGLVLWYRAEGDNRDSYGNYHAVVNPALGFVAGERGQAFDFNGQVLSIGAADIVTPWTAAFWINRSNALDGSAALLMDGTFALKLEQAGSPARQVGFTRFGVGDYTFNYTAPTGTWTHLAFVGTATNTLLYANGVAVDTNANTIALPLGQIGRASGDRLYSRVDEVQVFSRALGPGEVQNLFANSGSNLAASALSFDGESQWVEFTNGPTLGTNFTQEAWINFLPNDGGFHGFLGNDPVPNPAVRAPSLWIFDNTCIYAGFGDGGNWNWFLTTRIFGPNAWYHVAVTYNGSIYRVYVDGVDVYDFPLVAVPFPTPEKCIGRVDNFFPGTLDDVRVWNVTRSVTEIRQNMNRRLNGNEPGLLLNFHLDEGAGGSTSDTAPAAGATPGTLFNAPVWVPSTAPLQ